MTEKQEDEKYPRGKIPHLPEKFNYYYPISDRGRAIDILPRKELFDWIRKYYSTEQINTCDSGGYNIHSEYATGDTYLEVCGKPAVYKYVHTGEGQENWRDSFRCEQHSIPEREDLQKIKI